LEYKRAESLLWEIFKASNPMFKLFTTVSHLLLFSSQGTLLSDVALFIALLHSISFLRNFRQFLKISDQPNIPLTPVASKLLTMLTFQGSQNLPFLPEDAWSKTQQYKWHGFF
jgi:hypothetical protein